MHPASLAAAAIPIERNKYILFLKGFENFLKIISKQKKIPYAMYSSAIDQKKNRFTTSK